MKKCKSKAMVFKGMMFRGIDVLCPGDSVGINKIYVANLHKFMSKQWFFIGEGHLRRYHAKHNGKYIVVHIVVH